MLSALDIHIFFTWIFCLALLSCPCHVDNVSHKVTVVWSNSRWKKKSEKSRSEKRVSKTIKNGSDIGDKAKKKNDKMISDCRRKSGRVKMCSNVPIGQSKDFDKREKRLLQTRAKENDDKKSETNAKWRTIWNIHFLYFSTRSLFFSHFFSYFSLAHEFHLVICFTLGSQSERRNVDVDNRFALSVATAHERDVNNKSHLSDSGICSQFQDEADFLWEFFYTVLFVCVSVCWKQQSAKWQNECQKRNDSDKKIRYARVRATDRAKANLKWPRKTEQSDSTKKMQWTNRTHKKIISDSAKILSALNATDNKWTEWIDRKASSLCATVCAQLGRRQSVANDQRRAKKRPTHFQL